MIDHPSSPTAELPDHSTDRPNDQAGLSLQEAAAALGLSVLTVRRRIKRGELRAERVPSTTGFVYRVFLGADHPTDRPSSRLLQHDHQPDPPDSSAGDPERLEMLKMIERQQQTIMELAGRVGFLQAENQQLRLALEAPKAAGDEQVTPETLTRLTDADVDVAQAAATPAPEPTPDAEAVSRPSTSLWSRLMGWFDAR